MGEEAKVTKAAAPKDSRDYLLDNLRAVFIILVVWGHLLTAMKSDYTSPRSIYIFIFFFHMPAMAFISGYFSKNLEKIRSSAFVTILLPYLILNVLNYLYRLVVVYDGYTGYRFFKPYWGLWYLLVLFLWKFFLKDLIRIRFLLPISFVIALFSGFSKEFSEYMALGRAICFLPFFLLGYYCTAGHIEKIRKLPKLLGAGVVALVAALSVYLAYQSGFATEVLYLRKYYPQNAEIKGMLYRILVYVVAIAMIFAITNLVTARKNLLSLVGQNTMTVYILHLFTIPLLEKLGLFKNQPWLYLVYSILMALLITYIYSLPVVKKGYDGIMNLLTGLILKKDGINKLS